MRTPGGRKALTALALAMGLGAFGPPRPGTAADAPAPGGEGGRTALLFFMDRVQQTPVPLPPAEVRRVCTDALAERLRGLGHDVVDAQDLQPLLVRWRVRSDTNVGEGFLRKCREGLDAGHVVVVRLLVGPRQLTLMSRATAAPGGFLNAVGTAVRPLPAAADGAAPAAEAWLQALREICATPDLPADAAPLAGARSLVVMPAAAIGCDRIAAETATQALLDFLLQGQALPVVDPGCATAALLDAGLAPRRFGPAGRELLAARFDAATILKADLISYAVGAAGTAGDPGTAGDEGGVPDELLNAFALNLRAVDPVTGSIAGNATVFRDDSDPTGWFGRLRRESLFQRLSEVVASLWIALHSQPEGS